MNQHNKIILMVCLLLSGVYTSAQQITQTFTARILSNGQPVPSATIRLKNQVMHSKQDGSFIFMAVPGSTIHVEISAIGAKTLKQKVDLTNSNSSPVIFHLEKDEKQLEEVNVIGRTESQEVNRQAYNVTSIDAKSLYNTTLDLSHALDRVSGVRVRESGGVGSNFNFSLNGFSGNRVRFFLDGVPIDDLGSSFQINNIPINFAERVEVYKGVVPIWLGSDALGGAVNIVTGVKAQNYLDVSYSYGSFNTHRSVINAGLTSSSGLTFQLSAFQNYSDNNYTITVDASDIKTGAYSPNTKLKRFHDQYHNETVVAKVGVMNKAYADQLLVGLTVGGNYKEIQTGARMVSVFGARHRRGNLLMPSINYKKNNVFTKGLDLAVTGNYNFGKERNIDTVFARFDWFGDSILYSGPGGESSRSLYEYNNNNGLASATANYHLSAGQELTLNNVFNTFNRKGEDKLKPNDINNKIPRKRNKNVLGIGYRYELDEKISVSIFGKHFMQHATSGVVTSDTEPNNGYRTIEKTISKFGYGFATSYFINPNLQLKASYEKSARLPESNELFGDVENLEGNFDLKPESSDNVNIGAQYTFSINKDHLLSLSGNMIYRYATDYIYWTLNNNQSRYVLSNLDGVSNIGGDAELRYSFKDLFTAGANFTYQNVRNEQKYELNYTGISPVYHDRIPNLPYAFGNADASFFIKDLGGKGNTLSLGYNLLYVHQFYLYWPSRGGSDGKYHVPEQLAHDANITYGIKNGRYNFALECKNLTDANLYDNFSLQKPSRGFFFKVRYFINKS
ncbi:TonB-dependent receptor [Sphingobacterium alkalisoli]|uniref:TonB-dependent receptor n=1 Tax=Sphingobacterium alkalisoli TaxID=1874115 RepID=A0A4U0GZ02_9SPHI|nr:TonB-dependent receptor [Sphingobacterium alkalisoli]TJY64460.1 TonB-dependent receptor [Sphingobacterium alkalisoli]GGH21606.1 ligand-gated channel protein [Sphingobacterium alkalisoli]